MIAEVASLADANVIDKRSSVPNWPVRDQGQRGTCVAFALSALCEHLAFQPGTNLPDKLSEQFLFWATKTQTADPKPNADGTWIKFCCEALQGNGICFENLWPYNRTPQPGNVTQAVQGAHPSKAAKRDARSKKHTAAVYLQGPVAGGNALALLRELRSCRPVAISLPVFRDALRPKGNNWNTPVGVVRQSPGPSADLHRHRRSCCVRDRL